MRRTLAVAASAVALLSLSGCFKLDMDLTVNDDDTVDGAVIFAIRQELADMSGDESDLSAEDLPEGATVEDYDEDGFVGQKITLDDVPMADLNDTFSSEGDTGGPGQWSLTHEGGEYRFTGDMDLTEMASSGEDDIDMSALMQGAELRVALTFPGEITDSNGKIEGNTVTWEPTIGEKNEMTAVAEESSGVSTLLVVLIAGGAVVLLILGGLLVWVRSRSRQGGQQVPAQTGEPGATSAPPADQGTGL